MLGTNVALVGEQANAVYPSARLKRQESELETEGVGLCDTVYFKGIGL